MRYYSTQRPLTPGAFPTERAMVVENYGEKIYVENIGRGAWGHVEYPESLDPKVAEVYELIPDNGKEEIRKGNQ